MGMNRVIFSGNLGADPELKTLANGSKVAKFTMAVTEKYRDASGELQSETLWMSCEVWNRLAEVAGDYLKKGSPVLVEGKFKVEKWTDDQGQTKIKYIVKVSFLELNGKKSEKEDDLD